MEARLTRIEQQLVELVSLMVSGNKIKTKQHEYYVKRKRRAHEEKYANRIKNADCNNLSSREVRLESKFKQWAAVGIQFGLQKAQPEHFLEWLAYQYNNTTFWEKPVTKSGGYWHVFIGWSGTKPLRTKCTDCDVFGKPKLKFTATSQLQYCDAVIWKWAYCVLFQVLQKMEEDSRFKELPERFCKMLQLMCGAYGQINVHGHEFDPSLPLHALNKIFPFVMPTLTRGMAFVKRGFVGKIEPYQDVVLAAGLANLTF